MSALRNLASLLPAIVLAATAYAGSSPTNAGKMSFRWVDEKGVLHYGDHIPAEYATRERSVLNARGVEVAKLPAQRSAAQIADDEHRAEAQNKQAQHDSFLLSTYQSLHDIEQLRDARLQQLADQRRSTQVYVDSLTVRLDQLQQRTQVFKPYNQNPKARPMPDQLAEDIVRTLNEQRGQQNILAGKRNEEVKMREQFQLDIDRYSQLKGLTAASNR